MTDIFREIDEDLRRDRNTKLFRRLAPFVIAIVVLIVVGVGGWQMWRGLNKQSAEQAGARFEAALQSARESKNSEAEKALSDIVLDGPESYKLLSRLRLASLKGDENPQAGAEAFTKIADDESLQPTWRDLARLRATLLQIDSMPEDDVLATLQPLAAPGQPWRFTALEALGLTSLKAGKIEDAGRWFDQIITDTAAPANLRKRVQDIYMAIVAGGPLN